jgi:hypothetical protein
MPHFSWPFGLLAMGLLVLAVGCGPGEVALAPVHGKVLHAGSPLPGGTIAFTPDASRGGSGPLAYAVIGKDGTYSLKTGERLGAAPGWYRVTVVALEGAEPAASPQSPSPVARSLLPTHFRDPELSGLTCEVKPGQENAIDFHVD